MLINIPNRILTDVSLPSSAKIIYGFFLYSKSVTNQNTCRLTTQQIADIVGLERNSVTRLVQTLASRGLISIHTSLSIKNRPQYEYEVIETVRSTENAE